MALPNFKTAATRLRSLLPGATPGMGGSGSGFGGSGGPSVPQGAPKPAGPNVSPPRIPSIRDGALEDTDKFAKNPPPIGGGGQYSDDEILAYIDKLRQEAWQARLPHEGRFHTNAAFYYDKQWEFWCTQTGKMRHWRELDNNPYREWINFNLIKPKVRKLISRSMSANQEVLVSPKTSAPEDIDAAESHSAIQEHVSAVNHDDQLDLETFRRTHIVGPVFKKIYIDWEATLLVPLTAEDIPGASMLGLGGGLGGGQFAPPQVPFGAPPAPLGVGMGTDSPAPTPSPYAGMEEEKEPQILGVEEVASGDIRKILIPWYEALPDPRSHDPKCWEWFIHEKQMTLSEVQKRFPERGIYVQAGLEVTQADREIKTGLINNDAYGPGGRVSLRDQRVTVQELWHLPCPAFPEGLVAWRAGNVLLWSGKWIYPSLSCLPFVLYVYEHGLDTPWGFSAIDSARGAQEAYNKAANILIDGANEGYKVLNPVGTGIRADSFRRGRPNEVIDYDPRGGAGKPEIFEHNRTRPEVIRVLEMAREDMAEILEVQPVSDGLVPAGVTSGAAIQALEQNNRQGSRIAIETFRISKLQEAEIVTSLAKDVYTGKALLSLRDSAAKVSDRGNTEKLQVLMDLLAAVPQVGPADFMEVLDQHAKPTDKPNGSRVVRFDALSKGRVDIDVRITASKDPAQRLATLQDMASKGFFAPESIETTVVLLEAMQLEDADKLTEMLLRVLTRIQSRQNAALEEQKAAAAQEQEAQAQLAQQAQEGEVSKIAAQSQARMQEIAAQTEADIAKMQIQAQINLEHDIQMAQVNAQNQMLQSAHEAEFEDEDEEGEDTPSKKPRKRRRRKPSQAESAHEANETPQWEALEHSPLMANLDPEYATGEALEYGDEPLDLGEFDDIPPHPDMG